MPPVLADYQYQFKDSGVALNTDPPAPFIDVQKVSGLDTPEYRLTENDLEGRDGATIDAEFLKARTVTVEGILYAPIALVDATLDLLRANYAPVKTSAPFYFKHPSIGQRLVYGKPLGVRFDVDTLRRIGSSPIQIILKCGDPRVYSNTENVASVGLSAITGGMTLPETPPITFAGGALAGTINAQNDGSFNSTAVITFTGPVTNPAVECIEQGKTLQFNIFLDVGQTLVVDLGNRTVLLGGTANRRNSMTGLSKWFMLQPGANSLRFQGTAGAGTPSMQVAWRSAWN